MLTKADIARVRDLREKKSRAAAGSFVIEGEKAVADLLAAGFPFTEIYATAAWTGRSSRIVSAEEMARLSHFPAPTTVLAVGPIRREPLAPGALQHGLTLALDRVQDPGNVGTLLRIADWFGCARVLLSPDCADPSSQKAINASMGSYVRVPWHVVALGEALAGVTAPILGCDASGEDVHRLPPVTDAVVVVGSEGQGLSAEVRQRVARMIAIPGYGRAESLNAAVAAGIVCDQLRARAAALTP